MPTATDKKLPPSSRKREALDAFLKEARASSLFLKRAEAGASQESGLEQAFASLAHTYIADAAPKLLKYELGFQLLDRDEDGTYAAGAFCFKIGSHWAFAPVFFRNGELKGHELLYLKNQDMFVPLQGPWVNYLLGKGGDDRLGEPVDRNVSLLGLTGSNLTQIARSPYKTASAAGWRGELVKTMARLFARPTAGAFQGAGALENFMKEGGGRASLSLLACAGAMPSLPAMLDRFYGGGALERLCRLGLPAAEKRAAAGARFARAPTFGEEAAGSVEFKGKNRRPPRPEDSRKRDLGKKMSFLELMNAGGEMKSAAAGGGGVSYRLLGAPGGPDVRDLSKGEKEKLLKERYVIKDDRDDSRAAAAYDVTAPLSLLNPDATGLYEVLVRPDKFEKCLVVLHPYSASGRKKFCTVVSLDSKNWVNVHPSRVWTVSSTGKEAWQEWAGGLPEVGGAPRGRALLLTKGGQGTVPFEVEEADGDTWAVSFNEHADVSRPYYLNDLDPYAFNRERETDRYAERAGKRELMDYSRVVRREALGELGSYTASDNDGAGARIRLTRRPGGRLAVHAGGEVWAPDGCRVFSLSDEKEAEGGAADSSKKRPLEPGDLADVQLLLRDRTLPLKVFGKGDDVVVEAGAEKPARFKRAGAVVHLVAKVGLRERAAVSLVDGALAGRTQRALVKGAAPYELQRSGAGAPSFPEPEYGQEPVIQGSVPSLERQNWELPVQDMQNNKASPSDYDPAVQPDHSALRSVAVAAQTGQKEIFDTAALGPLLKMQRDDLLIDRNLPALARGVDGAGRILLALYAHADRFADRYGKADIPEIEDGLRNAFEAMGKVFLDLKAKKVGPGQDEGLSQDDPGDPYE
jgi:hypothetical protein